MQADRRQAETDLQRRVFELSVLNSVGRVCAEAESLDQVITQTTRLIAESLYPENCGFLQLSSNRQTLQPHSTFVVSDARVDLSPVPIDRGVVGRTFRTGQVQRLADVRLDPDYWGSDPRTRSEMCLPIRVADNVVGVFNIESSLEDAFSESDERMMTAVVDLVASTWRRLTAEKEAAAAVERQRQMLHEAQAIGHVGSFDWDIATNRLEWSDELLRIYGITRDQFGGVVNDFMSRIVPEDRPQMAIMLEQVLREANEFHFQERIVRPDGEIRILESQGKVFRDEQGQPIRMAGVCQDTTDRERSASALKASEERFSKLFYHSPFSVMLASYPEGVILDVNDAFLKSLEYERDEIVGKSTKDLQLWEDLEARDAMIAAIRRDKRFSNGEIWFRTKTGKRILKLLSIEIIEVQGQPISLAMSTDITERRQTEESLRQTAGLLQAVSEGTTDAVFVKDSDGKYLFFNEAAARFVGKSVSEVIGRDDRELFDSASAEFLMRKDRALFESGRVETSEETITAAGVTRTYLATKGPYRDHLGNIVGTIGISRDISERKQIESALRSSEERYRLAIKATSDAIWDIDLASGRVSWNDRYMELFGRPEESSDSLRWWVDRIHVEDRESTAKSLQVAIDGDAQFWHADYRFLRRDGLWADIHDRAFIARLDNGQAIRVVGAMQDVTAAKKAANELQATQRLVQLVAEASPLTIYVFDLHERRIVYTNDRVVHELGYSPSEVRSWTWDDITSLVHPDDLTHLRQLVGRWKDVPDGAILESEYRLRDTRGVWHWMIGRETVFARSPDGQVSQIVGTAQDITERRTLEQQFRESQKMEAIGRLAGGIAHDFNNLLTIINGYCHLLLSEQPQDDPCRQATLEIRDAGERAAQLTRQLLSFSRRALVDPKVLDLNTVVKSSETLLRRLIGEQMELKLCLTESPLPIRIDSSQMDQVLMNLAINAADAMLDGGQLVITTSGVTHHEVTSQSELPAAPGRYAQLIVADDGHGMPPEVLQQIFEPFFTTKERGKGTGLGLAVVYGIVQQCGGHIHVTSEQNQGSTFKLWIPIESRLPTSSRDPDTKATAHGRLTILVVEDDAGVRQLIRAGLESEGHLVLTAGDAADALRQFKPLQREIDLVISDVMMPGMSGTELVEVLRKMKPLLPVLYVSGYMQRDRGMSGDDGSITRFLQKPFTPESLQKQIGALLTTAENP